MSNNLRFFEYTSVQAVKDLDAIWYASADFTDQQILQKIRWTSAYMNSITKRWFIPLRETIDLSGDGSNILWDSEHRVPILEIKSIYEVDNRDEYGAIEDKTIIASGSDVVIEGVLLRSPDGYWSAGIKNYQVDIVRGKMEDTGKVETTLAADLSVGAGSMTLASVDGIYTGDYLVVDGDFGAIVRSVDTGTNVVGISEVLAGQLRPDPKVAGSSVVRYGRIPYAAEEACLILVHSDLGPGGSGMIGSQLAGPMVSETTDNYKYTIAAGSYKGDTITTGNPRVDMLLASLQDPGVVAVTEGVV